MVDSRVVVAVRPIGVVPFDGQTLPLISPDGRFLATQVGPIPSWATILAQVGAEPASSRVEIYDLTQSPPAKVNSVTPEPGVLLGRGSTDRGVLIEQPRPDGGRWIGLLPWAGGDVLWLVQGPGVCAHGVIGEHGVIAYTRRAVDLPESELVVRRPDGSEGRLSTQGVSYSFPTLLAGDQVVCAFSCGPAGLEVIAVGTGIGGQQPLDGASLGAITARRLISRSADPALAYQSMSPVQHLAGSASIAAPSTLLLHHPGMGRMAVFDTTDATLTPLAERTISGARHVDAAGSGESYFLASTRGLVHQSVRKQSGARTVLPESRVLSESWVPRATNNAELPFILIGPGPAGEPGVLSITAMAVVPAADAAVDR